MILETLFSGFGGIEIIVDERLGRRSEQFRFPRSKKKRIRKKWRSKSSNWRYVYDGPQMILVKKRRGVLGFGWIGPFIWVNPEAKAIIDRELAIREKVKELGQQVEDRIMRDTLEVMTGDPSPANQWTTYASTPHIFVPLPELKSQFERFRRLMDWTF